MEGSSSEGIRLPSALLVEDDSNDQMLLRRALSQVAPRVSLRVIADGPSAIEYLSEFAGSVRGEVQQQLFFVLLDVYLPRKSGWEILRWIKGQPTLAGVPVVLWTSLPTPEGVAKARELGAVRYFSKPQDLAGYVEIAAFISKYLGD
jgi:CheY-like chemotaxis protein